MTTAPKAAASPKTVNAVVIRSSALFPAVELAKKPNKTRSKIISLSSLQESGFLSYSNHRRGNEAPENKRPNMTNWKMTYTKLDGSRNTVTFTDKSKLDAALSKAKAANPNHDMAEVVESYDPFADVKPVSWKERASVRGEAAYNHRVRGY